jgi:MFS family permease
MASSTGKKYLLLISASGSFLAPFMVSSLIVAIPAIGKEFLMSAAEMSWMLTAFFLAASMFLLPCGRAADIFGVKRVFTVGIYVYFISALLAFISPSSMILTTARFLTGIGAAMIFGTSFAILSLSLPENERGQALGINIAGNLLGFALGFQAGGLLTYYLSWRWIFLLTLPIDLLVIALIHHKLPGECAFSKGQKLDLPGSVLIITMLYLIVAGFSALPSSRGVLSFLGGVMLFIGFIWWEMSTESPVINPRLFIKNLPFALSNGAALTYYAGSFGVIFLFSLYLHYIRELDARQVGLVLLAFTLIMAVLVSYAGRLSDRFSPYTITTAGILITLFGLLPLAFLDSTTSLVFALSEFFLIIVGGALFAPPIVKIILSCISREMYGMGSSLEETMRLLGNAASMVIITVIFTLYLDESIIKTENFPGLLTSMRVIFSIFFALSTMSLILAASAGKLRVRRIE